MNELRAALINAAKAHPKDRLSKKVFKSIKNFQKKQKNK